MFGFNKIRNRNKNVYSVISLDVETKKNYVVYICTYNVKFDDSMECMCGCEFVELGVGRK